MKIKGLPPSVAGARNFLESKIDILVSAQERFLDTLEDSEAKRVAQDKFEMWERGHSNSLKRVNWKITELKNEKQSLFSSVTASSGRKGKVSLHSTKSRFDFIYILRIDFLVGLSFRNDEN